MKEYELCKDYPLPQGKLKKQGWAWRPNHGETYGRSYMPRYFDDIKRIFDAGTAKNGIKLSPSQMLDELKKKYPGLYSYPGENEIQITISSLFAQSKSKATRKNRTDQMAGVYEDAVRLMFAHLMEELRDATKIKPKAFLEMIKEKFQEGTQLPSDFPPDILLDILLKSKLTSLRNEVTKEDKLEAMCN